MKQPNPRRALICLAAVLLVAGFNRAQAQAQTEQLDELVITGQAAPGAVLGDIPPENSLSQRDISAYGVSTISELLDEIALQTANGEGAGPIVLVNGRRVSGINEVGDLPTEAVLRVDILPEEVAIKYGYSAEQKVVNVILRRQFAAVTAEASGGASTDGGAEQMRGNGSKTRIRDNRRLNLAGNVQLQDSITEAQRGIVPASSGPGADPAYRTLSPERQTYTANAVFATPLSSTINSSSNIVAIRSENKSLSGLTASVPATQLGRNSTSTTLRLGGTLNQDVPGSWRLSLIGGFDHTSSDTDFARASLATGGVSTTSTSSRSNGANLSLLANRKLFAVPAGNLQFSLQAGGQFRQTRSSSSSTQAQPANSLSSSSGNVRASLDLPITRRDGWGGGKIGSLTANVNAAANRVSQFHTLVTSGYGLNWSPTTSVSFVASMNQNRRAPTTDQLIAPVTVFPGASVYDYLTGQSVLVRSTGGGNPDLVADDSRRFRFGATVRPFGNQSFTVRADYSMNKSRNAIQSLSGISRSLEAAFPQRFERDEDGVLIGIDNRPINIASQDRSSLRWGFNLNRTVGQPPRTARPPLGARPGPPGGLPAGGVRADGPPRGARPGAPGAPVPPAGTQAPPGEEVIVLSTVEDGPIVVRGMGPGAEAFAGEFDGAMEAAMSERGMGGGRGGGGGGGFGGFGGGGGTRLQLSAFHTALLSNEMTLRRGLEPIDLLVGGSDGGRPTSRHQVELNGGVTSKGLGFRLTGEWSSAGRVINSASGLDTLHFSALSTLNLRLFADMQQRLPQKAWAKGLRLTLTAQNLLNERQKVTNDAGVTPQAYQRGYQDPSGRTVLLSVRKIR